MSVLLYKYCVVINLVSFLDAGISVVHNILIISWAVMYRLP